MKKIILCEITKMRFTNEVDVMFNDGSVKRLFTYYPDEVSFDEREFIGLTEDEAMILFHQRDINYLRN